MSIPDTIGSACQVKYDVAALQRIHGKRRVFEVAFANLDTVERIFEVIPRSFGEIIDDDDPCAGRNKLIRQKRADKPRAAGNDGCFPLNSRYMVEP